MRFTSAIIPTYLKKNLFRETVCYVKLYQWLCFVKKKDGRHCENLFRYLDRFARKKNVDNPTCRRFCSVWPAADELTGRCDIAAEYPDLAIETIKQPCYKNGKADPDPSGFQLYT